MTLSLHSTPGPYIGPLFFLGIGIGVYFSLSQEPSLLLCCGVCLLLGVLIMTLRQIVPSGIRYGLMALFLMSLGMLSPTLRTALKKTPLLQEEIPPHWIEGTLNKIEELPNHQRITLQNVVLKYPEKRYQHPEKRYQHPEKKHLLAVRISLRGRLKLASDVLPGDRLRLKAALMPPSGPVAPGAYDFRRRSFFEGLSSVGYALTSPRKVEVEDVPSLFLNLKKNLILFRHRVTQKLRTSLGSPAGDIAAALVTGDRSGITQGTRDAFANAGTAHLLAISGLHLSVIAGFFFLLIRTLLALVPPLSLRYPVKKWAACAALAGTLGYLVLCGAPLPAQRAFFMSSLVLGAIMIDRRALTLRNVCLVAFILLLFLPESLTLPSFQLSFAAVIALVAAYEALQNRTGEPKEKSGGIKRLGLYFLGIAGTSLIATLATTPFIVQTFHKLTLHAIPANLAAVPWTSFVVIPLLLLYLALLPWESSLIVEPPLKASLSILLEISHRVSQWPGAVILVPPTSLPVLLLLVFGGLWICLVKKKLRLLGLFPLVSSLLLWGFNSSPPDLFISGDLRVIALRSENGIVYLPSRQGGRFARESFQSLSASHGLSTLPLHRKKVAPDLVCLKRGEYLFKNILKITVTGEAPLRIETLQGKILFDARQAVDNQGSLIWIQDKERSLIWIQDKKNNDKGITEAVLNIKHNKKENRPWSVAYKGVYHD